MFHDVEVFQTSCNRNMLFSSLAVPFFGESLVEGCVKIFMASLYVYNRP